MTIHPSNDVFNLVRQVTKDTGFDPSFIETHWYAEEGSAGILSSTQNWARFYNNPAGIRKGNPKVDQMASGISPNGFLVFSSPAQGARAYATLLNTDPTYAKLRSVLKSVGNVDYNTISWLAESGWDANHYTGADGIKGSKLYDAYYTVTGSHLANPFNHDKGGDSAWSDFANGEATVITGQNPGSFPTDNGQYQQTAGGILGIVQGSTVGGIDLSNVKWTDVMIVLFGCVLIIMLLYRMTK